MAKAFSNKAYQAARRKLATSGIQLLWTPWDREYRVTTTAGTKEEREARAYYTNHLDDAVGTGLAMAKVAWQPAGKGVSAHVC